MTGNTIEFSRTALNLDMSGTSEATIENNTLRSDGSGISVGFNSDGLSVSDNSFQNVGTDFNFRNLTTATTFDAAVAIGNLIPAVPANPGNDAVLILGGAGADTLSGTSGVDVIDGNNIPLGANTDADTLEGRGGNDFLFGRGGIDTAKYTGAITTANLSAVADADPFTGGDQPGWQVAAGAEGTDTLLSVEVVDGAGAGKILLVGSGGFATIQAAIDAASNGDTVFVLAGLYNEDLIINKAVTIVGAQQGNAGTGGGRDAASGVGETTIVGQSQITAAGAVTIDGLRFLNDSGSNPSKALAILSGFDHVITNSIFYSAVAGGANGVDDRAISISPLATGDITISDNYFTGASAGLFGTASWGRAIWFDGGGVELAVTGNTFEFSRTGINLDMFGTSDATIEDNTFRSDGTGISVGFDSDGVAVTNNSFQNVGTDFNFRNLTTNTTFDAATAVGNLIPAVPADPNNDVVVVLGGSGEDTLSGTSGVDFIDGNNHPTLGANTDADELDGRGGNDLLFGRGGTNSLTGGGGDDNVDGGDGTDTAKFSGNWADYKLPTA